MGAETLEGGDMINGPPTVLEEFNPPLLSPWILHIGRGLITKHPKACVKSCETEFQQWREIIIQINRI